MVLGVNIGQAGSSALTRTPLTRHVPSAKYRHSPCLGWGRLMALSLCENAQKYFNVTPIRFQLFSQPHISGRRLGITP